MAGACLLRLAALIGLGLMLGACTKCDVPTWRSGSAQGALACHDTPQPQ